MAKKLQMCDTEEEMRDVAAKMCRDYLHGAWKTIDSKELTFRRISGGLSNYLYYVALPNSSCSMSASPGESTCNGSPQHRRNTLATIQAAAKTATNPEYSVEEPNKQKPRSNSLSTMEEPKKVLLRIYGQIHGERAMDAIITESVIFTLLSERRLGPKLHGVFSGGRIEEYIPARPLLTIELSEPALSMKIAEKMAAIHAMDIPLSKEPQWLWKTLYKWMRTASEVLDSPHTKNNEEKACVDKLKSINFEKEIEWLKQYLTSVSSPVVFCHNDMQEGNILIREDPVHTAEDTMEDLSCSQYDFDSPSTACAVKSNKENKITNGIGDYLDDETNTRDSMYSHMSDNGEPKLVLIDFEYCAYNYRGFDLANHFLEWCFDYTNKEHPHYFDRPEQYPNLEQKVIFMRQYLKHCNILQQRIGNRDPELDVEPTIEDINRLNCEVEAFTLASHMLWCLWSVVSASRSQIPFGYWNYGVTRLEWYQRHKIDLMKKDNTNGSLKRKICEVDI